MFGAAIPEVEAFFADTSNTISMTVGEVIATLGGAEKKSFRDDAIHRHARTSHGKKTATEFLAPALFGIFSSLVSGGLSAGSGGGKGSPGLTAGDIVGYGQSRYERARILGTVDHLVAKILYRRSLSDLTEREQNLLRLAALLAVQQSIPQSVCDSLRWSLVWNHGACDIVTPDFGKDGNARTIATTTARELLTERLPQPKAALGAFVGVLSNFMKSENPELMKYIKDNLSRKNQWLNSSDLAKSPRLSAEPVTHSLYLGRLADDNTPVFFNGEESLITMGRPGTGKTQAHVIPNLLSYPGPMIVLDVKGECFALTSEHRSRHFGPVIRFDPTDPNSASYNPLDQLPLGEFQDVLPEARTLAELIVLVSHSKDPIWEQEARNLLTLLIAYEAYSSRGQKRPPSMDAVLGLLAGIDFVESMDVILNPVGAFQFVAPLVRLAAQFRQMFTTAERQFQGVRMAATGFLSAWDNPTVSKLTQRSDWQPSIMRQNPSPTLYLTVPVNAIERNSTLLRVIIGQHIAGLMKKEPDRGSLPVVFMLDEFPKLGNMKGITHALDTGRSYGIKLWFIAQYFSQLEDAYGRLAGGIVGACGARMYLNPGPDIAHSLERDLGDRVDPFTGKREPLATAQELMGASFRDQQLVLVSGERPARLTKDMAFHSQQEGNS
ncbi:MAG: type IV secretory system conjugative DNA transfer family protein [Hyphomicrobiaceae bacterium]